MNPNDPPSLSSPVTALASPQATPLPDAKSVVHVRGLVKEYPTRDGPLRILDGVDLTVATAESVALVGPSGCGKSTLLSIVGTLDTPTAGTVEIAGTNPFALEPWALASFRAVKVGFVFQDHHLLPQCTVLENVLLPAIAVGQATHSAVLDRARQLLERVGLAHRLDHRPAELSGGECQRTAIVRALINRPALLLADEPTGNLDRRSAQTVSSLLRELVASEAVALIVVTHSAELAADMPRRLTVLEGRLAPQI